MLWRAVRWLLFRFDPEWIHHLAVVALRALGWRPVARRLRLRPRPALEVEALGLRFAHPLGLAAGFDKGEVMVPGLFALGFSHVEIGTITPRPQPGNDRPRLFRLPEHRALVNRMGFNNDGAEACAARLAALAPEDRPGVVGVNVGRNKVTPNERAEDDYLACIDRLHPFADYLVVNISSPNTPGLRQLQERAALERLLGACAARVRALPTPRPLLVKLAPDLADEALDEAVDVALAVGAAGIVATNTTLQRPGAVASHPRAGEAGGLSGAPLGPLARRVIRRLHARAGNRLPIVGVGGVMSGADAYDRVRSGATLVQAYTGYIYGGPRFVPNVLRELEALLRRDGFSRLSDAIGADIRSERA
jgi:dihydroorotate dehydrogenase